MSGDGRVAAIAGAAGLAIGLVGGVVVWGMAADKDTGWWAAWGQWVGGIGAIVAAAVALWIAWRGWSRADADRRDAETGEAWYVSSKWTQTGKRIGRVAVRNDSERPVMQVALEALAEEGATETPCDVLWSGSVVDVLPPDETHEFLVKVPDTDPAATVLTDSYVPTIGYTNMRGRWRRIGNGKPERAPLTS